MMVNNRVQREISMVLLRLTPEHAHFKATIFISQSVTAESLLLHLLSGQLQHLVHHRKFSLNSSTFITLLAAPLLSHSRTKPSITTLPPSPFFWTIVVAFTEYNALTYLKRTFTRKVLREKFPFLYVFFLSLFTYHIIKEFYLPFSVCIFFFLCWPSGSKRSGGHVYFVTIHNASLVWFTWGSPCATHHSLQWRTCK